MGDRLSVEFHGDQLRVHEHGRGKKAKRISERNMGDNAPRLECKPVMAITEIWKEDGKKHIIKIVGPHILT